MKRFVKQIVAAVAYWLKLGHLLYYINPKLRGRHLLGVITFHRVIPSERTKHLAANYDIGLDVVSYESILNELEKYYDFIGLDDFIRFASGEGIPKRHSMMITFDDADSDFPKYAWPILKKHHWSAVIFAPVDYIDTSKRFWHLRVSNMMLRMDDHAWQLIRSRLDLLHPTVRRLFEEQPNYEDSMYVDLCTDIINRLDSLTDDKISANLDQLESLIGEDYVIGIKCMNWHELQALEKVGIVIESHSVTHRKLEHLGQEDVVCELENSKSILEDKLGKQVEAMCYPAGSYNEKVAELAGKAGYKVCFTTQPGLVAYPLKGTMMFVIPRLSIGGETKYEINFEIIRLALKK